MYRDHRIGVVVPAYNEAGFVGSVIDTMPTFVDTVYAVDDCSTDDTWAEIRRHAQTRNQQHETASSPQESDYSSGTDEDGSKDALAGAPARSDGGHSEGKSTGGPRVVPLRHERNRGVGAAIKTGYQRALEDEMDVVAVMNGDGQMDPAILDRILDPVVDGRAAYAKGNRLGDEEQREEMSRFRLFGNYLLTSLTRVASGYWTMVDPQNGYTAISADALRSVELEERYDGYGFCNDLLVALNCHRATIADVPMRARYGAERSTIRYRTFVPKLSALLARGFLGRIITQTSRLQPAGLVYLCSGVGLVAGGLGELRSAVSSNAADAGDESGPSESSADASGGSSGLPVLAAGVVLAVFGIVLDYWQNAGRVRKADVIERSSRKSGQRVGVEVQGSGDER